MGCDIHSYAEVFDPVTGKWNAAGLVFPANSFERKYYNNTEFVNSPFRQRNYGLFGFLANVRNYACCVPLDNPRGVPSDWEDSTVMEDYHSHTWFTLAELLTFDYGKTFWNRRATKQLSPNSWTGAGLAEEGEGTTETYRELIGEEYFQSLDALQSLGNPDQVRVVLYFDN